MSAETKTSAEKAEAVREYERQTNGTDGYHRTWMKLAYTDGMHFLGETCGAHWLLDLVASHQPSVRKKLAKKGEGDFQLWCIKHVKDSRWVVECWSDMPDKSDLFVRQSIPYSDFPVELRGYEFYVENSVCLMKGER